MRNLSMLIASLTFAVACGDDDCEDPNLLEGKLKSYIIIQTDNDTTSIIDTVFFEYSASSGDLYNISSSTGLYDYSINIISPTELLVESPTFGNYQVFLEGLQVMKIMCISGPSILDYCEMGVLDWEVTLDGNNFPDSVKIDIEYEETSPFVTSLITRGVLSEFTFDENYAASTYSYFNFEQQFLQEFSLTKSNIIYTSFLPYQNPYLESLFVPAPGVGLVKPIGPNYILEAAGFSVFRMNKYLVASNNDEDYDYILNTEGQVVEMTLTSPLAERRFLFSYY